MDLVKKVKMAHAEMLIRKKFYDEAKHYYDSAVSEYKEATQELEERDLEQAILDGRLKKVSYGQGKPRPLTIKQIERIAKQLNINLEETKDED